ncbi:uncharacterized protein ARMOST_21898 [Armillaria ostoyae]|uniref:Uncharacterized protein n=1 Tax=Armillaria ostoyae TaxID=47428 RepID=A0A284SBD8_ARMOS|nr:uncharacterized protein ARMOST_21898 [Armillaria ostoyae]
MALSHIGSDWDDISKVLQDAAIRTIIGFKADPAGDQHLSSYSSSSSVGSCFQVSSLGSSYKHYMLWQNSQEEAVLTIQGVLADTYLSPVAGQDIKSLSRSYQSAKIVCNPTNTMFDNAMKAIVNIEAFMCCHYDPVEGTALISRFSDDEPILPWQRQHQLRNEIGKLTW